jgi:hypothetical protein
MQPSECAEELTVHAHLGVIVGLLSTSVQSVGLMLQRKYHLLEEEKGADYDRRPPYKRRGWQLGMHKFIVANVVGSTIQITEYCGLHKALVVKC